MEPRWWVEVWITPPGERYVDAHPEHREKAAALGQDVWCGTVQAVGRLSTKSYKTKAGADRGAERARAAYSHDARPIFVEVVPGGLL